MRFFDPLWDGTRGVLTTHDYREWLPENDFGRIKRVARRTAAAMAAVGGRSYRPIPATDLYATSGASDDYAYSRHWPDQNLSKTHGFTMEFGYPTNFYPTLTEHHQNLTDVGAGLMEFCLAAAATGTTGFLGSSVEQARGACDLDVGRCCSGDWAQRRVPLYVWTAEGSRRRGCTALRVPRVFANGLGDQNMVLMRPEGGRGRTLLAVSDALPGLVGDDGRAPWMSARRRRACKQRRRGRNAASTAWW